ASYLGVLPHLRERITTIQRQMEDGLSTPSRN
ncbi:MAG: hypothetical protein ACI93G_000310, partial [Hyphomonas sp.]